MYWCRRSRLTVALYCAAAGIGTLDLIDFDVVEDSNLQRQIIHGSSTLGMNKGESAKQRLLDLNPYINVNCINDRLSSENALAVISNYDVVIDGTDNFPTRYLVNDACVMTGTPYVYGSIFRFEGQLSVFNHEEGALLSFVYIQSHHLQVWCHHVQKVGFGCSSWCFRNSSSK